MNNQLSDDADGPLWNLSTLDGDPLSGMWQAGDIGHITRTGENFLVTAVSSGTLSVVRDVGKHPPNLDYEQAKKLIREVCGEG